MIFSGVVKSVKSDLLVPDVIKSMSEPGSFVIISLKLIPPCIISLNPIFLISSALPVIFNTEGLLISVSTRRTLPILENASAVFTPTRHTR